MMETHDSIAVRLGERIKALLGMIEVQNQAVESWNHAEKSRGDEMEELKQTVHTVKDVLEASSEQKELQSRFALAQGQMIEKMKETIETLGEKLHLLEGQSSSHDAMKGVMNELQKTLDSCCEKGKKQEEFSLTQNRVIEGLKETIQTLGEKIHLLEEKPHNQTPSPNPLEKHPEAEPGHTVRTQFGLSPTAPETPNPHHLGGRGQL